MLGCRVIKCWSVGALPAGSYDWSVGLLEFSLLAFVTAVLECWSFGVETDEVLEC